VALVSLRICRKLPRTEVRGTDCKTKPFGLAEIRVDDDLVVGRRCFVLLEVAFEQAGAVSGSLIAEVRQ